MLIKSFGITWSSGPVSERQYTTSDVALFQIYLLASCLVGQSCLVGRQFVAVVINGKTLLSA